MHYRAVVDPFFDPSLWRGLARRALCAGVAPERIEWSAAHVQGLLGDQPLPALDPDAAPPRVSRDFIALADRLLLHRDPHRFALAYRMLWRLTHGEPTLLQRTTDPDTLRAGVMLQSIRRDLHKMKAFVRFRELAPAPLEAGLDTADAAWTGLQAQTCAADERGASGDAGPALGDTTLPIRAIPEDPSWYDPSLRNPGGALQGSLSLASDHDRRHAGNPAAVSQSDAAVARLALAGVTAQTNAPGTGLRDPRSVRAPNEAGMGAVGRDAFHADEHGEDDADVVASPFDPGTGLAPWLPSADEPTFVAWFEPEHYIVDLAAPFFMRRFTGMRWSILTPYRSVHWDRRTLHYAPGMQRSDAPGGDALEQLWRTYYASIFNPARLNPRMMRQEMAQKYWKNLPEAHLIPELIRTAGARVQAMADRAPELPRRRIPEPAMSKPIVSSAAVPAEGGLDVLRRAAAGCRACPLWQPATQTVFGEGPDDAQVMVIGEQPGDEEDLAGRPFVGPAGRLFDRALAEAGVSRTTLYVTNAVKHFKFEQRGKRRLHKNPLRSEQSACRMWLQAEIERLRPGHVVCLGAIAAQSVFGAGFRLMAERGVWHPLDNGAHALATVHPSFALRQLEPARREEAYRTLVADLSLLRELP